MKHTFALLALVASIGCGGAEQTPATRAARIPPRYMPDVVSSTADIAPERAQRKEISAVGRGSEITSHTATRSAARPPAPPPIVRPAPPPPHR